MQFLLDSSILEANFLAGGPLAEYQNRYLRSGASALQR